MIQDILIPSKIGNSYVFTRKVLSIDITQLALQGILTVYTKDKVVIKNKIRIVLKDFTTQTIVTAIKKIISTIGSYDEIVTSLSSSSVVFKELELPFIGREKLEMVVAYEVEGLLPFSLEQAVIDFIITEENETKKQSKILVAAALKEDVNTQIALFEKAGVALHTMTVDMFALYTLYYYGLYPLHVSAIKKSKKINTKLLSKDVHEKFAPTSRVVEMFIDVGFDVTRILYIDNGYLKAVRVVPYGIADVAQSISKKLELSFYDVAQQIIDSPDLESYHHEIQQELLVLFDHIRKTITFFEKQIAQNYKKPQKIIFAGLGCVLYRFQELAQQYFDISIEKISLESLFRSLNISTSKNVQLYVQDTTNLSIALFTKYNDTSNFLHAVSHKSDNILFYKQVSMILLLTLASIGGVLYHSMTELQRWDSAYIVSKKDLISTVNKTMKIDLKGEKNLKNIVSKAQNTLEKEHKLWFSFSKQTEQSYLEYLQDLSVHIDKESIGLDVKKLMIAPDKISLTGTLKDFEALEVFEEELAELELLQLVEKPRELTFTIQFKVKEKDQHDDT